MAQRTCSFYINTWFLQRLENYKVHQSEFFEWSEIELELNSLETSLSGSED